VIALELVALLALATAPDSTRAILPPPRLFVREFSYSPDGRELLFSGSFGQRSAVSRCSRAGESPRAVSDTSGWHQWGVWSPDGHRVLYAAQQPDSLPHLRVREMASGVDHRLTHDAAAEGTPAWSPDGRQIAYARRVDGHMRIWVMRADGRGAHAIGGSEGDEFNPVWSPDGRRIAYYRSLEGLDSLVVMRADGRERHVIDDGMWPHWSPDGAWLVFTRGSASGGPEIWRMTPDGREVRFVVEQGFFARYTPEGSRIAFLRPVDVEFDAASHLYEVGLDGKGLVRVLPR